MKTLAFLVQRIGPYHHARLKALAKFPGWQVKAVEYRVRGQAYAWDQVDDSGAYERITLISRAELPDVLQALGASVVVCTGYADPEIQRAAAWAMERMIPLVTCSDSTFDDEPRSKLKEAFKRHLLRGFDTAFVAGQRSRSYLGSLGVSSSRCFSPWDVVDNEYFDRESKKAQLDRDSCARRHGIPNRFFLCVARFVQKKNLPALIAAYGLYLSKAGTGAWDLVISGSGELEAELRRLAGAPEVTGRVHFPGFVQYTDLPIWYGLAEAFVLPSLSDQWGLVVNEAMASGLPVLVSANCGCAPDLVADGENGFLFPPGDQTALSALLLRISRLSTERRELMGTRSREIISAYTPDSHAHGLMKAVSKALESKSGKKSALVRAQMKLLSKRGNTL